MLELLGEANQIARHVEQSASSLLQNNAAGFRPDDLNYSLEAMKQRFLSNAQDSPKRNSFGSPEGVRFQSTHHHVESQSGDPVIFDSHSQRASIIESPQVERLPPIRSGAPSRMPVDGFGTRLLPSMNPPPAPRVIPSPPPPPPPSRSRRETPPYNIPSPTSMNYPPSIASTGAIPSSAVPPLSPTMSTIGLSPAIQAHTAALQHEVSIKKFALATLQSEHDKLLAALSRSKTRARALEEKQVASDIEVNTLSEDRVRLLQQITELEEAADEMKRSRDEYRDAAVKEGKQYVEIVKRATILEEQAGREKKEWLQKLRDGVGPDTNKSSSIGLSLASEDEAELKAEIQWLREKCKRHETLLQEIQSENMTAEDAAAVLRTARQRISDSITDVLAGTPPFGRR
jgi:hypothetical protein